MSSNSTPGWYDQKVPTTAEWNASYAVKVDATNGYAANLFVDGLLLDHMPIGPDEAATKAYVDQQTGSGSGFIPEAPIDTSTYGRLNQTWNAVLPITGGSLTGSLTLAGDPTAALMAATKGYADLKLALTGGTLTGPLLLAADPVAAMQPATKQYVDTKAPLGGPYMPLSGGTATGLINAPYLAATASLGGTQWGAQGAYIGWNYNTGTGFNGGTDFINSHGLGSGGFAWYDTVSGSGATPVLLMFIRASTGVLTVNAGANFGGPVGLPADPSTALQAVTKQYVDNHAPLGGPYLALTGGTLAGALTLAADPAGALQPVTLQYYNAHLPTVPVGSSTPPIMDGAAAVGVGPTWARADHVHPSDTSRLALTGGTLTGPLIQAADPVAALGTATKQYVDLKAPLASPALTGTPTAPTAVAGTSNTQIATTAFVLGSVAASGITYDARGNVGFHFTPPADAATYGTAGSWLFFWGMTTANFASNLYYDGTGWRYLTAAEGWITQQLPGSVIWEHAPSGAAGAAATVTSLMSLNSAGNLSATGTITAASTVSGSNIHTGGTSDAGYIHSTGNIQADGAFTGGSVSVTGNVVSTQNSLIGAWIHSTGSIQIDTSATINNDCSVGGRVYCGSIMNQGGVMYVAGNYAYYFNRNSGNGVWQIVDNNNLILSVDPGGNTNVSGTIQATGFYMRQDNSFWFGYGGNGKLFQFQGGWYWEWFSANGFLRWIAGSSEFLYMMPGSWVISNSNGPMGGHGPYQDYSDERIKEDVQPAGVGLPEILAIEPIRYIRLNGANKEARRYEIGFSAQQLRTVIPEAVSVFGITMPDGRDSTEHEDPPLGVATTPVVAALVNAMQTIAARLDALESKH